MDIALRSDRLAWGSILLVVFLAGPLSASGLYRNGAGGRALGTGGAAVASTETPLAAMWANPAALASIEALSLEAGYIGAYGDASFRNSVNGVVDLEQEAGHGAELAIALPVADSRGTVGLSIIPETALASDWRYVDAPGGTNGAVTYGRRVHRSEIIAVRGALGLGWEINDRLAVGASVGLVYERIEIEFPFIFQTNPGLAGFKTLLDLETDGLSWNADAGMTLRLHEDLSLGLRYRSSTSLESEGDASGEAGAQFAALGATPARTDFQFDSRVNLSLPDVLSAGLAWQASERLLLMGQVDWIPWSRHLDHMRVTLSNGDNPAVGSRQVDRVPVGWEDRVTLRLGAEYAIDEQWALRAGYIHTSSPIPARFVTPVNAAISEHTIAAGVGYQKESWSLDLGYQVDLRKSKEVETSAYQAGEYSNSKVSLLNHWWGVSSTWRF